MESLDAWLDHIALSHPVKWDLGLERVGEVAVRLQLLPAAPLVFLVGGTNGKGTTATLLAKSLQALGYKTGLSTSPHLLRFNERIVIDSMEASDEQIVHAFTVIDEARGDVSLTYFEFACLASLLIFTQASVDACVLEVGLGGRLDAMNIVDADVSIVTRIALDHQEWLGNSLGEIAIEKAGIFRKDKPAIIGSTSAPVELYDEARRLGARTVSLGREFEIHPSASGYRFKGQDREGGVLEMEINDSDNLPIKTQATVLQALLCAGVEPDQRVLSDLDICLPGRYQWVGSGPRTLLDVCHNPDAVSLLVERIRRLDIDGSLRVVMAAFKDKDHAGMIDLLAEVADEWYFSDLEGDRGSRSVELNGCLEARIQKPGKCYDRVEDAWKAAIAESDRRDVVLVCGSFMTVSKVMQVLEQDGRRG